MKEKLEEIKKYQDDHVENVNQEELDGVIYDNIDNEDELDVILEVMEDSKTS